MVDYSDNYPASDPPSKRLENIIESLTESQEVLNQKVVENDFLKLLWEQLRCVVDEE